MLLKMHCALPANVSEHREGSCGREGTGHVQHVSEWSEAMAAQGELVHVEEKPARAACALAGQPAWAD